MACVSLPLPAAASTVTPLGAMPRAIPSLPVVSVETSAPLSLSQSLGGTSLSSPAGEIALSWVLQSLAGNPHTVAGSGEWVLIGKGLLTIPKRLLEKICNWEFVDLTELLPTASTHGSLSSAGLHVALFSLFPGCEVVHHKRQISSIADWVQAFAVYMVATVSKHPTATLELLAYMLTTIKASQQHDGLYWRSYDTNNYRIIAAASGNKTWLHLDMDLYTSFLWEEQNCSFHALFAKAPPTWLQTAPKTLPTGNPPPASETWAKLR